MRQVYIAGVGSTRFGRHPESSLVDLAVDAIEDAIKDAQIDRDVAMVVDSESITVTGEHEKK